MARTLYVNPASTAWSTVAFGTAADGPYTLDKTDVLSDDIIDLNGLAIFTIDESLTAAKIIDGTMPGYSQLVLLDGVAVTADYGDYSVSESSYGILLGGTLANCTATLIGDWDAGRNDPDAGILILDWEGWETAYNFILIHTGGFNGVIDQTYRSVVEPGASGSTYRMTGVATQPAGWVGQWIWANTGHGSGQNWTMYNYGQLSFTMRDGNASTWANKNLASACHIYNMSADANVCLSLADYNTPNNRPVVHPFVLPANQVLDGINRYDGTEVSSGDGTLGTYPTTATTQAADAATLTAVELDDDGTDTTVSLGASTATIKSASLYTKAKLHGTTEGRASVPDGFSF
jgi:hypothetical protein